MNAVGDVAKDFLQYLGTDMSGFLFRRDNDGPGNEELLLRALFNDQYEENVLPNHFNQTFSRLVTFSQDPEEYLNTLLPTDGDLQEICLQSRVDREKLNALLLSQGQEPFGNEPMRRKKIEVDENRILMALANIVMQQSKRIEQLEHFMHEITKKV